MIKNQSGQAVIEYIVILAIVVGFYLMLTTTIASLNLERRFHSFLIAPFANTYKYGHPEAQGFDEGTPKMHPRIEEGPENFRIFIMPKVGQ